MAKSLDNMWLLIGQILQRSMTNSGLKLQKMRNKKVNSGDYIKASFGRPHSQEQVDNTKLTQWYFCTLFVLILICLANLVFLVFCLFIFTTICECVCVFLGLFTCVFKENERI